MDRSVARLAPSNSNGCASYATAHRLRRILHAVCDCLVCNMRFDATIIRRLRIVYCSVLNRRSAACADGTARHEPARDGRVHPGRAGQQRLTSDTVQCQSSQQSPTAARPPCRAMPCRAPIGLSVAAATTACLSALLLREDQPIASHRIASHRIASHGGRSCHSVQCAYTKPASSVRSRQLAWWLGRYSQVRNHCCVGWSGIHASCTMVHIV